MYLYMPLKLISKTKKASENIVLHGCHENGVGIPGAKIQN